MNCSQICELKFGTGGFFSINVRVLDFTPVFWIENNLKNTFDCVNLFLVKKCKLFTSFTVVKKGVK